MNIIFVTTELADSNNSSGGLASFTANIAKIFAANGHKVFIMLVTTQEKKIEFEQDVTIIPIFVPLEKWKKFDKVSKRIGSIGKFDSDDLRITLMNLYKGRKVRNAILKINEKANIDIIHYCNHGSLSRVSPKKIPYIIRISGFINILFGGADTPMGSLRYEDNPLPLRGKLEEYTIRKSRYIVSPSNLIAKIVNDSLGKNATVIESPFLMKKEEWNYSVLNENMLDKRKYVIYYGSLRYYKGIHIVAQLVRDFLSQHPDYYIVLAGKNSELVDKNSNKILADEFVRKSAVEFADRVIYAGCLVREQLYPLIKHSEICLLPSRIENLPNACIEAMAMGKIVVATNGASYEQLIEDRVSGFLCERDNPDSYLKAINEALSMSLEEKEKMALKAVEVTRRLTPQSIYQQYLEFYEKVIKEW